MYIHCEIWAQPARGRVLNPDKCHLGASSGLSAYTPRSPEKQIQSVENMSESGSLWGNAAIPCARKNIFSRDWQQSLEFHSSAKSRKDGFIKLRCMTGAQLFDARIISSPRDSLVAFRSSVCHASRSVHIHKVSER